MHSLFLALGNCTLDDVVTIDGQIAPRQIGGNGVYAAVGMRLWGVEVALVSVIGNDFPVYWLDVLSEAGVDVSAVRRLDMPHLLRSRIFYLPDGRRTDLVEEARPYLPPHAEDLIDLETEYTDMGSPLHRELWPRFSPTAEQLAGLVGRAGFAHLAPGPLENNRGNAALLKAERGRRVGISLDWPWWDWDREGEADRALLANIDFLLPSIEELTIHATAVGREPFEAIRDLLAMGPRAAAVKMGARGARVLPDRGADWVHIPVAPTTVVDPTGAGDAFCGGFLVGMAETGDPVASAQYGAVSASFIIESFGPQHALSIRREAAVERLRQLRQGIVALPAHEEPTA